MEPPRPVNQRWVPPSASVSVSGGKSKSSAIKPVSHLPRKPVGAVAAVASGLPRKPIAGLPSKPAVASNGSSSSHSAPTLSPGAVITYDRPAPAPTPSSSSPSLPGVSGRADISIWPKPLPANERTEVVDQRSGRKRTHSVSAGSDTEPATPLSLAHTRLAPASTRTPSHPDGPIPVLPPPLPSKRAKRGGASTAVLLPVEKLPVFPLPPPPPISDPKILRQVFTHQSLFPHSRGSFEDAEAGGQGHYEKLEHVGDSILGMVVTTWLHELKPGLKCGTATKLKAHLVSNATLSHISGMYNFPQRLNGDARLLPVLRAQTDVRAALVEAYIAGVYFSFPANERLTYGMAAVTTWLRELYGPLYDFFLQHMRREYAQHYSVLGTAYDGTVAVAASPEELDRLDAAAEGMALLVKMYAAQRSRTVTYDVERYETSVGVLWRMRCALDGVEMGDATRSSRYRARNAAAWEAAKKLGLTAGAEL